VLQRAHVVQPVGQLDQDDARVLRHREQQLAVVLDLLLGVRPELHPRDLGDAVHHRGDLVAEGGAHVLERVAVVSSTTSWISPLASVTGVQVELGQDLRDLLAVDDVVLARVPLLPRVRDLAELVGASSAEGVGSPLGWLCARITLAAASTTAGRNTSRGWTREASSVPRVTGRCRTIWFCVFSRRTWNSS
jgi:hypothetical protein